MSRKVFIEHILEYLLLLVVLTLGYLVLRFVPGAAWKVILTFTIASFYLGYGSYHHFSEKNLKVTTVLEYSVVATIIAVTLLLVFG